MNNRYGVVLAAGQGKRMKSDLYKVLHPVCGRPMVEHVVNQAAEAGLDDIVTIIGHGAEAVKEHIGNRVSYVLQEEQQGTGHAVMQAEDHLKDKEGVTVVLCGDTPLIRAETVESLIEHHEQTQAKATVLTAHTPDPSGYGRVIRNDEGHVLRIVEEKDADRAEQHVNEINTGTYCFDNKMLFEALREVGNENAQGEYYLPDVLEILKGRGEVLSAWQTADFSEAIGVNDRVALAEAEKAMKKRINTYWLKEGVTIADPDHTYISPDAVIGRDTTLHPGTVLNGVVEIEGNCEIGPFSEITDSHVSAGTVVRQSVVSDSRVGQRVKIGPYAHIRPASELGDDVKIGNFVEVKKSSFGNGSKVPHLSYIGDAAVGKRVNMGCGSITVNYDGTQKYTTTIEDDVFVGCNANLIAPVKIERGAYVAAGSTITDDVPEHSLSIARSRQTNKEGYVKNKE
ncbi:bifunctional UDP-N-acetylglucosamine diphosphorylase/glucosamine-1-phosphate N-acetyltransferase GlmU [Salibacterium halotolerans]|uniref:Bifunctional protein GlmU n=1 Tax=Salibacterium halotolerans TaxID=1884432 RepID=A0A1I5WN02_9BACI|nr:bifunctional UDP-N-acetylglucosamine diphosphorylase/glucosamine-1-phosphate N-acetyltransferase GlmU [Salibacterium halotolerans]SFQ20766.1 bifunctional UDP-N-acetylglucosamine pyrophosphorylase / Glucosamine-1-phosphate N-acetyltransferase [Salibacterium halotolerans]